jgi:ABC-type transporter Mla maintaining outer membrane lipid asymmetry ATPase subunit MlaF
MSLKPLTPAHSPSDGERENRRQPNDGRVAIEMRGVAFGAMSDQSATVAEDVNWTVNAGEFWVVAGGQRSGKTDFLMLTDGLLPPTRGTYRFFAEEMPIFEDERLADRLRLGLVFDGGQLFNHMTVAENVALPLRYHRNLAANDAAPRVQAMLELTELLPFASNSPTAIARNWQKRAGLARALILQPDVLLLDNPLTGLDARHATWWLSFLDRLARGQSGLRDKPMTIIATADDLRAWRGHAQRVACLSGKR